MSGDAIDRLRKLAQNEQTVVGMSHLLRAKEIELIQLRELLRLKTDQFQHEAEQNAQLRADLSRVNQDWETLDRKHTQLHAALAEAERERDYLQQCQSVLDIDIEALERERDTLKAQNADLLAALQIVKEQRQNWWGKAVERGQQLARAEEARKLCAVQMKGLDEERERLAICLKASEKYARGVKADFDKALTQLTTSREEAVQARKKAVRWEAQANKYQNAEEWVKQQLADSQAETLTSREEGFRGARKLLEEAMRFCCLKDGDGDFLNEHLAVRIRDYIKSAEASTLPSTYEQGAGEFSYDEAKAMLNRWADPVQAMQVAYAKGVKDSCTLPTHPPRNAESKIGNGGAIDDDGDMLA